jgi:predicted DNA-binding protein|tara:strand:+ start:106 stop:357 length:252 start_codon:yes stop_codon:yes gene_type:complete
VERDTKTLSIQKDVGARLKVISIATGRSYSELIGEALTTFIEAQEPNVKAAIQALMKLPPETFAAKSGWGVTKPSPKKPAKSF